MRRLGLFGGTFDPVHVGHLDVAEAARRALALDEVLLMPANVPPHRASPRASAPHRFAMAALAIAGREGLGLLDLEMLSQEPSYTTTTLDRLALRLRSGEPGGLDLRSVFLITGADAFRDIGTWKDYPAILDRCQFVVVSRPDCPVGSLHAALPALADRMVAASPGLTPSRPSIVLVDAPTAPVSSTDIRRRLAGNQSVAGMVPDLVARHIERHGLYT
jgi:nicotinate-nucleotide adenylyltransferase